MIVNKLNECSTLKTKGKLMRERKIFLTKLSLSGLRSYLRYQFARQKMSRKEFVLIGLVKKDHSHY